jgi:uncharacterized protein (TIGR02145 family)
LQGNSGSYSATVTVQLNIVEAKFNWCAYVSDYPPNMIYVDGDFIFNGTPPFILKLSSGTDTQIVQNKVLSATALEFVPDILTDATECSGIVNWIGCNWGDFNLGTVSFVSSTTYQVSSQIWSAPVQTTGCSAKTTFNGGSTGNYNIDCRNHTTKAYGDLFSWCMVVRYADQLCPSPWRVPTYEDWQTLDKAMGGNGKCRGPNAPYTSYLNPSLFGAAYSNFVYADNSFYSDEIVNYTSLSQHDMNSCEGTELVYDWRNGKDGQNCCATCPHMKGWGNTLRCVKTN